MAFLTYENYANPHCTVHREGCKRVRMHGGHHKYSQGKYQEGFSSYEKAIEYAEKTNLPSKACFFCRPDRVKTEVGESEKLKMENEALKTQLEQEKKRYQKLLIAIQNLVQQAS